jgi:hypothetical protein
MDTLLRLLPAIRRTRGPRLYAANGQRFLDFWLDDGREILGEAGRKTRSYAANALDKGLVQPYPGLYDRRLEKAILGHWPAFKAVRYYLNDERALAAAARLCNGPVQLADSAWTENPGPPTADMPQAAMNICILRPFTTIPDGCHLALVRLPCPRLLGPACLVSDTVGIFEHDLGDVIPALQNLAAARAMDSLQALISAGSYGPAHWERFDRQLSRYFRRQGPYLQALITADHYPDFFKAALRGGVLLSPAYQLPSCVPPDFDDGELHKLAAALECLRGSQEPEPVSR